MNRATLKALFLNCSQEFLEQNSAPNGQSEPRGALAGVVERKKTIYEVHPGSKTPRTIPEQAAGHESLAEKKGKDGPPRRLLVRVTSVRRRLLDPDNLIGKYFVDCLRYAGILGGDTEAEVDFRIAQKKARTKDEEKTIIEVEYCSPIS